MRLIDADTLQARMYHEAFEADSDMQKWDSGCWIRYKLFENCIDSMPTIEPEIIRCMDCIWHLKDDSCARLYCITDDDFYCWHGRKAE